MATFGTGAGSGVNGASTSVAITPPASATILVGGIAINYFTAPTITMTWDGGATVAAVLREDTVDEVCALRYAVSPGTSEANLAGGGGNASDDLHLAGIGVAGTETTDPVRDSISGEVTAGADISWTPTGLVAGDAMFIMATVLAAGGGQSLAAGSGTSSAYLDSSPGSFTQAAIFAYKNAASDSDTIDVVSGAGTVQYVGLCIKGVGAGGGSNEIPAARSRGGLRSNLGTA